MKFKSKSFIDDSILMHLLKNDSSNIVAQEIYKKYKKPFVHFFEQNEKLPICRAEILFNETMKSMLSEISKEKFIKNVRQSLFNLLIVKGYSQLEKTPSKNQLKPSYLAGEILIQLILEKYTPCIDCIFQGYKDLTIALLNRNYGHCINLFPEEIYGEAIMTLKNNIEKGRLKHNLRSRLFTYFYLISRNKYLGLANHLKKLVFNPDLIELKTINREPSFINYIENYCPVITPLIERSEKGVFQSLLTTFQVDEQELLRLRFEEGLRFSEIGKRLKIKEATCRKRLHDCLKKWKKKFLKEGRMDLVSQIDRNRA